MRKRNRNVCYLAIGTGRGRIDPSGESGSKKEANTAGFAMSCIQDLRDKWYSKVSSEQIKWRVKAV